MATAESFRGRAKSEIYPQRTPSEWERDQPVIHHGLDERFSSFLPTTTTTNTTSRGVLRAGNIAPDAPRTQLSPPPSGIEGPNRSSNYAPELYVAETDTHILPEANEDAQLQSELLGRYTPEDASPNATTQPTYIVKSTGAKVTIKKVLKGPAQELHDVRREIAVLSTVADPTILALVEGMELHNVIWLVKEHRNLRSIHDVVRGSGGPLPEEIVKTAVNQLFSGIAALFMARFAHLRICADTVCLDDHQQIVITDLQYACEYGNERTGDVYAPIQEKFFSDIYVAPEVFANHIYNARKAVIWSCGVLLYFMTTCETEKLSNLDHPSFDTLDAKPDTNPASPKATSNSGHTRKLSVANAQSKIIMYPNSRFSVPQWARAILPKMLTQDPMRRAELIEVATRVPKDYSFKATRPLMELAWLDYKTHVGPYAGLLHVPDSSGGSIMDSAAGSSIFSAASRISQPFASLLGKGHSRRQSAPVFSRSSGYHGR